ncbi:MAG TPA: hypothetical protein PKM27_00890 [Saprospiraceae bacterium]|nr:hypothetical protein [Saprospiraceae bacterium]HNT19674.1 hypothetical protein [Saprospiraceae bacterium]
MNREQIDILLKAGRFPHPSLIETHISYVILGNSLAYKFKKEIKYSFLDFSTLKKRKFYCEREVLLNNRFSKGVYLGVVAVRQDKKGITVDGPEGKIIDYAVKMKRLKSSNQMHRMLEKKQVTRAHIQALASTIRRFHLHTDVIRAPFRPRTFSSRFNDLLSVSGFVKSVLGSSWDELIKNAVRLSDRFLKLHHDLFIKRIKMGFIRDCHGDLHSRNIFLYRKPILFDCIEFNDDFRKMDVLDEIAFFCMDLEAEGFYLLSKAFTDDYFHKDPGAFGPREQMLFTYYKSYRANVRAKVNALRAMKAEGAQRKKYLDEVKKYLKLMDGYLETPIPKFQ